MSVLSIKDVNKRYGHVQALDCINLEVSPGVFGLLGPNGAGKTTLMRILATLLHTDSGRIMLDSLVWNHNSVVRSKLGYLPQKFEFFSYLTVQESLCYIALLKNIPQNRVKDEVDRAMALANMTEFGAKQNRALSGGMLRRLGVAQAILGSPEILIIDEPTAGLDPSERLHFRNVIASIASEKTIVLLSTHIVQEIEEICNQVAIMQEGRILVYGSPYTVMQMASGHIAQRILSEAEFRRISRENRMISYRNTMDGILARFLYNHEDEEQTAEPTLEDAYMFMTRRSEQ